MSKPQTIAQSRESYFDNHVKRLEAGVSSSDISDEELIEFSRMVCRRASKDMFCSNTVAVAFHTIAQAKPFHNLFASRIDFQTGTAITLRLSKRHCRVQLPLAGNFTKNAIKYHLREQMTSEVLRVWPAGDLDHAKQILAEVLEHRQTDTDYQDDASKSPHQNGFEYLLWLALLAREIPINLPQLAGRPRNDLPCKLVIDYLANVRPDKLTNLYTDSQSA